jgi:hypothetical protein
MVVSETTLETTRGEQETVGLLDAPSVEVVPGSVELEMAALRLAAAT